MVDSGNLGGRLSRLKLKGQKRTVFFPGLSVRHLANSQFEKQYMIYYIYICVCISSSKPKQGHPSMALRKAWLTFPNCSQGFEARDDNQKGADFAFASPAA